MRFGHRHADCPHSELLNRRRRISLHILLLPESLRWCDNRAGTLEQEPPAAPPPLKPCLSLRPGRDGIPDLDVVEEAVLAGNTEFDLGLGGMGDAGGLEIASRFAVDGNAHLIADG